MVRYIRRLRARSFGCLKDATVELTPLHAFIGPNDSGKSTLLEAAGLVVDLATHSSQRRGSIPQYQNKLDLIQSSQSEIEIWTMENVSYRICNPKMRLTEEIRINGQPFRSYARNPTADTRLDLGTILPEDYNPERYSLTGSWLVRFEPDRMHEPSSLIPDKRAISFEDERGKGLAGVYDAIRNQSDDTFEAISRELPKLFPTVKHLRMFNVSTTMKVLGIELLDGTLVPSDRMSEGMLFWLGFAAIRALGPPSLLLVEEPENGLHPARIAEVVRVLRDVSQSSQVLIATHSPLVVNELEPEEVTLVTRDAVQGTIVHPIKDTPNFTDRSKIFALGELWLSYANGDDEAPLLSGEDDG
ncbi:MAG: AAA family ATPase [Deltaproteobacteria bacterium]|nr:AAA family ATPase [Deltaproteobacteria bacterium]